MSRITQALALTALVGPLGCGESLPDLLVEREESTVAFHEPKRACITCHPQHVQEWSESNHAYAIVDPVFHAMVRLGQQQSGGKVGQFCVQCHTPIGMALGETPVAEVDGVFVQDFSNLSPAAKAGVTCDVCHTIEQVIEPRNARMVYTPNGTFRGPISDPVETHAHKSTYSELHESSDLCGSCHNVVNPAGALIEETYDEWAASSFAEEGETCQDCHMPVYEGKAATDGPDRTVHRHTFTGVDVSLLEEDAFPGYHETRQRAADLLASAAEMDVSSSADGRAITVDLRNKTGHRLPSGATAERQMWLEVTIHTEDRDEVFASGTLDAQGDLRDSYDKHTLRPGTDPQLVVYRQIMLRDPAVDGGEGDPRAVDFPWQATDVDNTLLEPNGTATHTYDLSTVAPGTYQATVRLLFRTFPPYFLRILEEEAGLDPAVKTRVPIVTMQESQWTLTISGDAEPDEQDGDCDLGYTLDCLDSCSPEAWIGDGFCDDSLDLDLTSANFDCWLFDYDGGDCLSTWTSDTSDAWDTGGDGFDDPICDIEGDILDCQDLCWPAEWLGDAFCDDGTSYSWGSADFRCEQFDWDLGDCEPDVVIVELDTGCEQDGWIMDCQGVCYPDYWLGDGVCDDGAEQEWGSPDFDCLEHFYDDGDCNTSSP